MSRVFRAVVVVVVLVAVLESCARVTAAPGDRTAPAPARDDATTRVLVQGADRLVADGVTGEEVGPDDATAWASVIQAPHRQTDRDVGAAGIAYGLLAAADVAPDADARERWTDAARGAADFLVAAQRGPGRVPDYVDPSGPAGYAYSSYDDGAAGISDLLWTLGERTGEDRYRDAALAGMDWLLSRAEDVPGAPPCPAVCRWAWSDDGAPSYRHGMGEGQSGIVYALAEFAERTGDPRYAEHAAGGAAYLESVQDPDGGMPERANEPQRNTSFLSGAAGAAFVFLRMYQATGEDRWRAAAERSLDFVDATAIPVGDGLAWPILVDPANVPTNANRATGMEEGAAGIGWVSLQAARILGDDRHRERAAGAGRWLLSVAQDRDGGLSWPEYEGSPISHLSTNSGAAGTGWFLDGLGEATGEQAFTDAAQGAEDWLVASIRADGTWPSNLTAGRPGLVGEPSWHWGSAGILGFLAHTQGWPVDSPGMQPGLG